MVVQCCWPPCLVYIFSWIPQPDLFPLQDILYLHNSLEEVNSALMALRQSDLKLEGRNETVSILTQRVKLVERSGCYEQGRKASKPVLQHGKPFQIFCDVLCVAVSFVCTWMTVHHLFRQSSSIFERLPICIVPNPCL